MIPVPATSAGPAPATIIAIVENPALPRDDPHNWSDVIEFIPDAGVQPPTSHQAQMFSEGCGSGPTNESDISCFPTVPANQFVDEVRQGTGDDFKDCTTFNAVSSQGQGFGVITECSDAALAEQPGPSVPEVPLAAILPVVAVGVVAAAGLRRRLGKN